MTIDRQREISYSMRKSILDSPNNDIIFLLQWCWRLIASCNVGQFSHLSSDRMKKKENSNLERYLLTMCGIWSWKFKPCTLGDIRWWMDRGCRMMDGWRAD